MKYRKIIEAFAGTIWAIEENKLEQLAAYLEYRANGGESLEVQAASGRSETRNGSIAVLPILGTISPRMNMMNAMSGGVSLDRLGAQFDALVEDSRVSTIVLDVDSPGGSVYGVPEFAKKVRAARKKKNVVAVANTLAASAAYWIGSSASSFYASPSADVGSIGVYAVHSDISGFDEQSGVKRSIIKAGKYKAEGNPYQPLSEDAREYLQSQVDEVYGQFVRDVAQNRGVSVEDVRNNYGQGRVLTAKAARQVGMIDGIQTMDEVIKSLQTKQQNAMQARRFACEAMKYKG